MFTSQVLCLFPLLFFHFIFSEPYVTNVNRIECDPLAAMNGGCHLQDYDLKWRTHKCQGNFLRLQKTSFWKLKQIAGYRAPPLGVSMWPSQFIFFSDSIFYYIQVLIQFITDFISEVFSFYFQEGLEYWCDQCLSPCPAGSYRRGSECLTCVGHCEK